MNELLQGFFERNAVLVYFIYGLIFFLFGFSIALHSWKHTHLELASSLPWLAAFGISHGIHEWLTIIVPFQAMYVSDTAMSLMLLLQLFTLVISFFCLFQFGADLLMDRWPWLAYVPLAIALLWTLIFFVPNLINDAWSVAWHREGAIWARYLLGLPGALLASYGLYYQAKRQIEPLSTPHIYRMFQVASITFFFYAFMTGFIVPAGDFFPANLINDANLIAWTGVPIPVFRSLAGMILLITIVRGLNVFDVEVDRQFEAMEIERSLVAQRERIGHELHDGAIQQVYTAGLIIESVRNKNEDPLLDKRLENALSAMNEAIAGLRSYMESLRADEAPHSLAEGLRQQTADPRLTTIMQIDLDLNLSAHDNLSPVRTNRILAVVGHALANAARHGRAQYAVVTALREGDDLWVEVVDNGRGYEQQEVGHGYGLRDMRDHARLLGGELVVESQPGEGTRVVLTAPWDDV